MRPPIVQTTDSPEKKAITLILLKKGMRMKAFWEKHSGTRRYNKPLDYRGISSRLNRSVSLSRTVNLLSVLGHTIAIVPMGATVTVANERGAVACECCPEKEIVMVTTDETEHSLTQSSFPAEPHSPREEW